MQQTVPNLSRWQWPGILLVIIALVGLMALAGCVTDRRQEVLIGISPDGVVLLRDRADPDPVATGIESLDALNREWGVESMVPVYPDVAADDELAAQYGLAGVFKLVLPAQTDVEDLIAAYEADPHIEYAEANAPAEAVD